MKEVSEGVERYSLVSRITRKFSLLLTLKRFLSPHYLSSLEDNLTRKTFGHYIIGL
jgi:hypothetical protein